MLIIVLCTNLQKIQFTYKMLFNISSCVITEQDQYCGARVNHSISIQLPIPAFSLRLVASPTSSIRDTTAVIVGVLELTDRVALRGSRTQAHSTFTRSSSYSSDDMFVLVIWHVCALLQALNATGIYCHEKRFVLRALKNNHGRA
jgi:hypothetical protein